MKQRFASLVLCTHIAAVPAAEYTAVLDWSQRAVLSTPVSGVITSVDVAVGDRVAAGQQLLQLDQRPFESSYRDAKAQLRKHSLLREEARRELERTRELYERRVISVHDLQIGEIAYATEESDYTSAVAALDSATLELEYSTLKAPFAGIILSVDVTAGMTVINTQLATAMVTLGQERPMQALAQVSAGVITGLEIGQAATVSVNDKAYRGRIRYISAEPDTTGNYTLAVSFDPGEDILRAGQLASIDMNH